MCTISLMQNRIQPYAWGSHTLIAELLGQKSPADKPQAELWMGAHPKASSKVYVDGCWTLLSDLIEAKPDQVLGEASSARFSGRMPYLFKVLAVRKPLSIQAHPNQAQALRGFKRESDLNIALDAANRSYVDAYHKPECIAALTSFWALCGFQPVLQMIALLETACPIGLSRQLRELKLANADGLERFFKAVMILDVNRRQEIITEALGNARRLASRSLPFEWILRLHAHYPDDIGVLFPLFLNLVHLGPGEALALPAGELHAYLEGLGIELMANSDNVLRGGLTPKYVDVAELLKILHFKEMEIEALKPQRSNSVEAVFQQAADEFMLSILKIEPGRDYQSPAARSIDIILCIEGSASITDSSMKTPLSVRKGCSVMVPAVSCAYRLSGSGIFYKASVPL